MGTETAQRSLICSERLYLPAMLFSRWKPLVTLMTPLFYGQRCETVKTVAEKRRYGRVGLILVLRVPVLSETCGNECALSGCSPSLNKASSMITFARAVSTVTTFGLKADCSDSIRVVVLIWKLCFAALQDPRTHTSGQPYLCVFGAFLVHS